EAFEKLALISGQFVNGLFTYRDLDPLILDPYDSLFSDSYFVCSGTVLCRTQRCNSAKQLRPSLIQHVFGRLSCENEMRNGDNSSHCCCVS
ncbi:MAG: hypothetical protein ACYCPP_03955, partial [Nitrososphaerales archaeon]